ncbi:MAG TPA: MBL fold metallo-hydrolase [bacterium]|nr:MBL fold metallo-hydrolase [bacterium]
MAAQWWFWPALAVGLLLFSRIFMVRITWRAAVQSLRPARKVPDRLTDLRVDNPAAVTWLGHATALVQLGDAFILTDPVLKDRIGAVQRRLVEPGVDPAHLPPIDLTVISHAHLDHLDLPSLRAVPGHGIIVAPHGVARHLPRELPFAQIVELKVGESYTHRGVTVTVTGAKHWGGRAGVDGLWDRACGGFYFAAEAGTVFYAGDTGYDAELFAQIGRVQPPDIALIPLGPSRPRWVMRMNHLGAADALRVFDDLRAGHFVAVHHSTFIHSTDPPHEPRHEFLALAAGRPDAARIHVPFYGEQLLFAREGERLTLAGRRGPNAATVDAAFGRWR